MRGNAQRIAIVLVAVVAACSKSSEESSFKPGEMEKLEAESQASAVETLRRVGASITSLGAKVEAMVSQKTGGTFAQMPPVPQIVKADESEFVQLRASLDGLRMNLAILGDGAPCDAVKAYNLLAKSVEAYASSRKLSAPANRLPWRGQVGDGVGDLDCPK